MYRVGWLGVVLMGILLPVWAMAGEPGVMPPQSMQIQVHPIPGGVVAVAHGGGVSESFPKPSEYWLGVECTPVDPTLRSHLQLPEGQGLVVRSVAPDSPAAKAGLREHDILLQAGDKKLSRINDLVEAVDTAKEQKLSLEIVREGKRQKIEATPAKRPAEQMTPGFGWGAPIPAPGNPDFEAFRKWFEKMQPGQPLRFRFFQPGFVAPPGFGWQFGWQAALPEGLSIAVTKSGNEPARISVKKDGQTWEVTEKELEKLPPDIRPHVERMLGRGGPMDMDFPWEATPPKFGLEGKEPRLPGRIRPDLQKQLEKHQQELEKLQKQFEELKKSLEQIPPERDQGVPEAPRKELKKATPKPPIKEPVKEKV